MIKVPNKNNPDPINPKATDSIINATLNKFIGVNVDLFPWTARNMKHTMNIKTDIGWIIL